MRIRELNRCLHLVNRVKKILAYPRHEMLEFDFRTSLQGEMNFTKLSSLMSRISNFLGKVDIPWNETT